MTNRLLHRREFLATSASAVAFHGTGARVEEQLPNGCSPACLRRYPAANWETIRAADIGFDERALQSLLPKVGVGGMIIRHGYCVAKWGDIGTAVNTASLGKSFTSTCLALAVDAGMVQLDDLVWKTWTGEGQLSHKYKYLNVGNHRHITWRHLATMTSGFPDIDLAAADGDMGDITSNYAKRPPGNEFEYSDGAMWRFSQVLTKLWNRDLRDLVNETILSKIGVSATRWNWLPGRDIYENLLYPFWPGYGRYLDPPWEIGGHLVRGGPGWVIINASDLARFGYMYLRNGRWKDNQLISAEWVKQIPHPGSRSHGPAGGTDYNLNWWLPGRGIFEMRGGNINWQAVSRLAVIPHLDMVISSVRTSYLAQQTLQSAYYAGDADYDWLFRIIDTVKN